jgi:putative ABC transport system substrate-binding protein
LAALQPAALYTWTSGGAGAAINATSTIPIIVGPVNEAFLRRHVPNFAHPGGNITGFTLNSGFQHEKCLQLLKEVAPQVSRVGVLLNPLNPAWDNYPAILAGAAQALGIELIRAEARGAAELDMTFAALREQGANGLLALEDSTLAGAIPVPERLLELIDEHRLPSVSDAANLARQGGLLALGRDPSAIARDAARYVHRVLQGESPGQLPIQTPTEFTLIVNLKTAKTLSLDVPVSVLARAHEIIEEGSDLIRP